VSDTRLTLPGIVE